jgi:hypothetical protein
MNLAGGLDNEVHQPRKFQIKINPEASIEIGLEQAAFVVFVYFFPHLNMQKT